MFDEESNTKTEYKKYFEKYKVISEEISKLDKEKKEILSAVADMLHNDEINTYKTALDNGEFWLAVYQDSERKDIDMEALYTLCQKVNPDLYYQIVTTKKSTSLRIKKEAKSKASSNSKRNLKPVKEEKETIFKPSVPIGTLG